MLSLQFGQPVAPLLLLNIQVAELAVGLLEEVFGPEAEGAVLRAEDHDPGELIAEH